MKHLLLTTIAAVVLVGCGEAQQPAPRAEAKPEPPTAKAPDISIDLAAGILGNIETVKKYLDDGKDVNAKNDTGMTPLHNAALYGRKEILELLIAEGADVNAKDGGGNTPLDWAIKYKRTQIADILRKHGGKTGEELKAEGK